MGVSVPPVLMSPPARTQPAKVLTEDERAQEELWALMGARRGKPIGPNVDLYYVNHPNIHWRRRKDMLKQHPEIEALRGYDSVSQIYCAALVSAQLLATVAVGVFDLSLLWVGLLSFFFGAYVDHALWCLVHDFSHDLGAASHGANTAWLIIANLAHVWPSSVTFRHFHNKHHGHFHVVGKDPDLAVEVEQNIFGNSTLGKIVWLSLFPFIQTVRVGLCYENQKPDLPLIVNWIFNMAVNISVLYFLGFWAFLYLFLSSTFSVGLHPMGARWIAEHYSIDAPQETYSTYGSINFFTFNIGHHNEHHDFPNIPWSRLPQLRKTAPEYYDFLTYHTSYLRVLFAFLFNSAFTLHTRVVRAKSVPVRA